MFDISFTITLGVVNTMQIWELVTAFGTIAILMVIIALVVDALLLGVALGPLKGRNRDLGTTVVTAVLMALSYLALIIPYIGALIACILQLYFIKSRHEVGWGGAAIAWIVLLILQVIVLVVILFAFFGGLAILFGILGP
jgi:hypothetical protein